MKRTTISKAGDWSQWSKEQKQALELAENNYQVGEKKVFENSKFRIWSIHLPAGQSLPFHKHANPYFWTVLNEGKSRSHYNDGSIIEAEYEKGDTTYFDDLTSENYFIHNLENIGSTTLIFTTVEFLHFVK